MEVSMALGFVLINPTCWEYGVMTLFATLVLYMAVEFAAWV